LTEE